MFFDDEYVNNPALRRVWRAAYHFVESSEENGEENTSLPHICRLLDARIRSDAQVPRSRVALRTSVVLASGAAAIHRREAERLLSDLADFEKTLVERNKRSPFVYDSSTSNSDDTPEFVMRDDKNKDITMSPPIIDSEFAGDTMLNRRISTSDQTVPPERPTDHQLEPADSSYSDRDISDTEDSHEQNESETPNNNQGSELSLAQDSPTFTDDMPPCYGRDTYSSNTENEMNVDEAIRVAQADANNIENSMNHIISSASMFSEQIMNITSKMITTASIFFEENRKSSKNILNFTANYLIAINSLTKDIIKTATKYSAETEIVTVEIITPGYSEEIKKLLTNIRESAVKYSEEVKNMTISYKDKVTAVANNFEEIRQLTTKTVVSADDYAKQNKKNTIGIVSCTVKHLNKIRENLHDDVQILRNTDANRNTAPVDIVARTTQKRSAYVEIRTIERRFADVETQTIKIRRFDIQTQTIGRPCVDIGIQTTDRLAPQIAERRSVSKQNAERGQAFLEDESFAIGTDAGEAAQMRFPDKIFFSSLRNITQSDSATRDTSERNNTSTDDETEPFCIIMAFDSSQRDFSPK